MQKERTKANPAVQHPVSISWWSMLSQNGSQKRKEKKKKTTTKQDNKSKGLLGVKCTPLMS